MRSLLTFMLLVAAVAPALVLAGPFGYEKGQVISGEPDGQMYGLFMQSSPLKFADWDGVRAYYTHETGVCAVRAVKYGSGRGLRRPAFGFLVETLTKKYGAFENIDVLQEIDAIRRGIIWDEPKKSALGTRLYLNADPLEDDLENIGVWVESFGLVLQYIFNNYDACKEAASKAALSDL